MVLPPDLLQAISAEEGGKVALILGAGCSFEPPTNLPLSRGLSEDAHSRLVADNVLASGDCADPSDLSCVADVVFDKTAHQDALVDRFPLARLRNAAPNDGYLLAVALLREHAVSDVLTLNFDLAIRHALGAMNAGADVGVVRGPQEAGAVGVVNVVYLHRDAESAADEWILRTVEIEAAWKDGWEELVTTRVMSAPVVVFAGLGTAAAVLVETIRRVRAAVEGHVSIHVDPFEFGSSPFTATLEIPEERFVQAAWTDFMLELADRVAIQQLASLRLAITELEQQNGFTADDLSPIFGVLEQANLLQLGAIRARWMLRRDAYLPARGVDRRLVADLAEAGSRLARELGVELMGESEGRMQMRREGHVLGSMFPASGAGVLDWASFEAALVESPALRGPQSGDPLIVLAAGVSGSRTAIAPPENLIDADDADDNASAFLRPIIIDVNQLRVDPGSALAVLR